MTVRCGNERVATTLRKAGSCQNLFEILKCTCHFVRVVWKHNRIEDLIDLICGNCSFSLPSNHTKILQESFGTHCSTLEGFDVLVCTGLDFENRYAYCVFPAEETKDRASDLNNVNFSENLRDRESPNEVRMKCATSGDDHGRNVTNSAMDIKT